MNDLKSKVQDIENDYQSTCFQTDENIDGIKQTLVDFELKMKVLENQTDMETRLDTLENQTKQNFKDLNAKTDMKIS